MVTRCHEGYFHWWRKTLAGEATLELLVDVSALTSSTSASSSSASSTSGFDAAAHEQLTRRAAATFRRTLGLAEHSPPQQQPDYISTFANLEGAVEAASHDWKRNEGFEGAYGSRRVHKWEHVERFSLTLIARLEELLRLGGVAAHGEMLSSTVCLAEPWCQTTDLRLAGTVDMDAKYYGSNDPAVPFVLAELRVALIISS
ncbi:hypothetical protein Ctob_009458 [Chrysochromulina tobinii]|uniref:Uncharacterized protein n=1 Tax=Chrysochromulina tobinii TaxID=1460289 RepID=A0A0M0JL05_9EUKA|nr:hypothetical protein Ctob_009458 [Chrysochromulina tobinii]|eukprot:KOO27165.1 hypothetical protein Ctob_009458 [Chrysochromulina sp. CCMP291]